MDVATFLYVVIFVELEYTWCEKEYDFAIWFASGGESYCERVFYFLNYTIEWFPPPPMSSFYPACTGVFISSIKLLCFSDGFSQLLSFH